MTNVKIDETISHVNGILAITRYNIRYNEFDQAISQLEGANLYVLLAKTRVEEYVREKDA